MKKEKVVQLKIERGIPISPHAKNKGYAAIIRKLKLGDSVELPSTVRSITSAVRRLFGKGHMVARTTKKGCRVWRIK